MNSPYATIGLAAVIWLAATCATGPAWPASETGPALTTNEKEQEPTQVRAEAPADGEKLPEGSAWYPPAMPLDPGQGIAGPDIQAPGTVTDPEAAEKEGRTPPSSEWVLAPIPFSNPTLGSGIVLGIARIFAIDKSDLLSPPSVVGVGAMRTVDGNTGFAVGGRAYFQEDRHRVTGWVLNYDIGYDFYGVGSEAGTAGLSIPIRQRGEGFGVQYLRLWRDNTYLGARYSFSQSRVSLDVELPPWLPDILTEVTTNTGGLGLVLQRDKRNSTFYPTEGSLLESAVDYYAPTFNSDFSYQVYSASYSAYRTLSERTVLASRAYARQVGGEAPFFALSLFGSGGDLRGYTAGQYRDKLVVAAQTEYRQQLPDPWGYVVFAGVGEVAPRLSALSFEDLLYSVGVGVRYTLAKENRVNMRMDVAYGKEGSAIHFGVGEAF